jgi:hypothetical protein
MKALTGLSSAEFSKLSKSFEETLARSQDSKKTNPKRASGGGAKHTLKTGMDKLFFILLYLKVYPTYDVYSGYQLNIPQIAFDKLRLRLPELVEGNGTTRVNLAIARFICVVPILVLPSTWFDMVSGW